MKTITASNQAEVDERVPGALPCHLRIEPMEGPVDPTEFLPHWFFECEKCGTSGNALEEMFNPCGCEPAEGFEDEGECDGKLTKRRGPGILSVTVSGGDKPLHPEWVRSIRDQCEAAGVQFVFESWGEWQNGSHKDYESHMVLTDGRHGKNPQEIGWSLSRYDASRKWHALNPTMMARVGRERSGRILDGRTWDELPEVASTELEATP